MQKSPVYFLWKWMGGGVGSGPLHSQILRKQASFLSTSLTDLYVLLMIYMFYLEAVLLKIVSWEGENSFMGG